MTIARTKQQNVKVLARTNCLHIETPLGLINIHLGLHDDAGRNVETIAIAGDKYAGEPAVTIDGWPHVYHQAVRLVQETEREQLIREEREHDAKSNG